LSVCQRREREGIEGRLRACKKREERKEGDVRRGKRRRGGEWGSLDLDVFSGKKKKGRKNGKQIPSIHSIKGGKGRITPKLFFSDTKGKERKRKGSLASFTKRKGKGRTITLLINQRGINTPTSIRRRKGGGKKGEGEDRA